MPTHRYSPTVRRRRLAAELRRIREERGLTLDQAAAELDWHATKLSRFETARRAIQPSDVRALIAVYGIPDQEADRLLSLAREARQRGWWQAYGEAVPDWFASYVGLESEASSLRLYESEFIPGLLQTEDYAYAIARAAHVRESDQVIERRVAVRLARQELLICENAPHVWVVVNEAVVRRSVGGPRVMSAQLTHLLRAAALPNLTLQLLPFVVGAHPGMDGAFHLLSFAPEDHDVVYVEYATGTIYLERSEEVERYGVIFDYLRAAALPTDASRDLIKQIADEL